MLGINADVHRIVGKIFVAVIVTCGMYIAYKYLKQSMNSNFTWYLQNFTDLPSIVHDMQPVSPKEPSFRKAWKHYKQCQLEQAMFQGDTMGQIEEQLYAPLFTNEEGMASMFVELIGNLVTVFPQDKPCMSMYIHPQDTTLSIMQKFGILGDNVLVIDGIRLDDMNKKLLQYGIPDNRKVDAVLEPRVVSSDQQLDEIFRNM